jgi:alpha-beta hydrolase superfamily lysophospholipase
MVAACLLATASGTAFAQTTKVALTASDGQPLVAGATSSALETTKGGVVLVPNAGASRWAFELAVPKLSKAGFAVLALDPRGHGDSIKSKDGAPIPLDGPAAFRNGALDIEAACRHSESVGVPRTRIAVLAAGTGCLTATLHAAAHPDQPKALLLLSPPVDDHGIGAAAVAKSVARRAILLAGSTDEATRSVATWKEAFGHDLVHVVPTTSATGGAALFGKTGCPTPLSSNGSTRPCRCRIPS